MYCSYFNTAALRILEEMKTKQSHTLYWWMEKRSFIKQRWTRIKVVKCVMREIPKSNSHRSEIFTRRSSFTTKVQSEHKRRAKFPRFTVLLWLRKVPRLTSSTAYGKSLKTLLCSLPWHWHLSCKQDLLGHLLLHFPNTWTTGITPPLQIL